MRLGNYGNFIRIGATEDITLNTNTITLISPNPVYTETEIGTAEGLVVGAVLVEEGGVVLQPDTYVEYQIQEGDISCAGEWRVRLDTVTPSDECKVVGPFTFTVEGNT